MVHFTNIAPSLVHAGTIDAQGFIIVEIKQSRGVGLSTPSKYCACEPYILNTVNWQWISLRLTSPMRSAVGHADETITVDAFKFCLTPTGCGSVQSDGTLTENNGVWSRVSQANAQHQ